MKHVPAVYAYLFVGAGGLLLAACDVPTDVPILEQNWVIAVEGTTIGVAELVPSGVSVSGSTFDLTVDPVTADETLGNLCSACFDSPVPIPVPEFDGSFGASQTLPADVLEATIASGAIDLTITNGFTFDPLENGGNGPGTITVTVTDGAGGPSLGSVVWDGGAPASESLPPGTSDTKTLDLTPATIGATLVVTTLVDVPGGQTADSMDTSNLVSVDATPGVLSVSTVLVNVTDKNVSFGPEPMGTDGIGTEITENIIEGSIILEVGNPFGISMAGSLDLGTTSEPLNLGSAGSSTVTISYTGDELRQFLGVEGATFEGSGVATSTSPVLVAPDQELTLEPTLDFIIQIGG